MLVSKAVTDNLTRASWIRRMFEEGARLKQERGADKVFDFTLGNPEIEPPSAVLRTDVDFLQMYSVALDRLDVREANRRIVSQNDPQMAILLCLCESRRARCLGKHGLRCVSYE